MLAVKVENLVKKFRQGKESHLALKGLNLEVEPNQIFGLLGSNGAGKTTLLSILATTLSPTQGKVEIYGKDVVKERLKVREIIGICSGYSGLFDDLTVRENLIYYSKMRKMKNVENKARELLKLVELEDQAETVGRDLSTGMRQRLSIAIALMGNPKLLLMDEPTVGLDPVIAYKIRKNIQRIQKKLKMTIILTTHNMHEAERMCDNIALVKGGKIITVQTVSGMRELMGDYQIIEVQTEKKIKGLKNNGIESIGFENDRTVIKIKNAKKNLSNVFDKLKKFGILRIAMREMSLEELYMELVK